MWNIYSKDGKTVRAAVDKLEYHGTYMGEKYLSVSVTSSSPIAFEIGDYIEYRDERFEINYDPSVVMTAPADLSGEGFSYDSIKFNSLSDELTRCMFLDVVKSDNKIHYTSLAKFSFYCNTIQDLADRIQANLDRVYGEGTWTVTANPALAEEENISISVDTQTIWDVLATVPDKFEADFIVKGRTITIGVENEEAGKIFTWGKNNGLYEIEREGDSSQQIITRLRAYGSTKNLPERYYNKLTDADGNKIVPDNMAVTHLMLPSFPKTTLDPYIDSGNIDTLGIRESSVFFDGSGDEDEIYPTLEDMTADDLKAAGISVSLDSGDNGNLDEVVSAENPTDNGLEDEVTEATFKITIKDVGFDINDYLSGETATISMKDGFCGGREFEITRCIKSGNKYILTCKRTLDSDLGLYFPYKDFYVKPYDKFVLLNIEMPDVYIAAASGRLLTKATEYLAENCVPKYTYAPKIDEIYMARQHDEALMTGQKSYHDTICEGMKMHFKNDDLGIDTSIIISELTINENGAEGIPTYDVTLSEDNDSGTISKMQSTIDGIVSGEIKISSETVVKNSIWLKNELNTKLSKTEADTAAGHITFADGLTSEGAAEFNGITNNGDYSGTGDVAVEGNVTADNVTAQAMETVSAVVKELLTSESFRSGLTGEGFGLSVDGENIATLEVDKLTVRQTMKIFELLVDKVRSTSGTIVASAGNGKVESVTDDGTYYTLTFDNGNEFVVGDLIRCQNYNGTDVKSYWVEVAEAGTDYVKVKKSEFEENVSPAEGDDVVLMGNSENATRQSLVTISASEGGVPAIDIYREVDSKSLAGKLSTRLGVLDGITDNAFPYDNQPQGVGLYSDNAYLKGKFVLSSGEDVSTKFAILEGQVKSEITSVKNDSNQDSYIYNGSFLDGFSGWQAGKSPTTNFYGAGNVSSSGKWIWANSTLLSKKDGTGITLVNDNGRTVVRLDSGAMLTQVNDDFAAKPSAVQGVKLTMMAKVTTAGTLLASFRNSSSADGYKAMSVSQALSVTDDYKKVSVSGQWNGTGDIAIAFTGELFAYDIRLVDSVEATYKTLFEQTDKLVSISAAMYGSDKSLLKESGLMVTADYAGLYAVGADGNLKSLVGAGQDGVKIKAESIELEGEITANGEFAVDKWGNVKTGTQYGITTSQYIVEDKSNLIFTSDAAITLPNDKEYIGRRLLIVSQPKHSSAGVVISSDNQGITDIANFPKVDITTGEVFVKGVYGITSSDGATEPSTIIAAADDNDSPMLGVKWFGGNCAYKGEQYFQTPSKLTIQGGYIELLGVSYPVARTFRTQYAQLTADGADALVYQVKMARYDADGHVTYDTPYSEEYTIADADESGATITDNGTIIDESTHAKTDWEAVSEMCMWTVVNANAANIEAISGSSSGSVTVDIRQSEGSSTTAVMSQKATTDALGERDKKLQAHIDKKLDKTAVKTSKSTSTSETYAATYINTQLDSKQDKLTAGTNISISGNTISCTIDTTLYKVVTSLPTQPASGDESKIFLVASSETGTSNNYKEYIWKGDAWEQLGEFKSEVDLTPYFKTANIDLNVITDSTSKVPSSHAAKTALEQLPFIYTVVQGHYASPSAIPTGAADGEYLVDANASGTAGSWLATVSSGSVVAASVTKGTYSAAKYITLDGNIYQAKGTNAWNLLGKLQTTVIDSALSTTSTNPVQNKVINTKLTDLQSQITAINAEKATFTVKRTSGSNVYFCSTAMDYYIQADCSIVADKIVISQGGTAKNTVTSNKQCIYHESKTASAITSPTTLTYTATATLGSITKTASVSVYVVNPIYIGAASTYTTVVADTYKQTARTSVAGTYTVTVNTSGDYVFFVVPSQMTINKVTLSGFDFPLLSADTSSKTGYKIYKSANTYKAGTLTLVVS